MSAMDYRYPEGMMFDERGSGLFPDPDDRTDEEMAEMYPDAPRSF